MLCRLHRTASLLTSSTSRSPGLGQAGQDGQLPGVLVYRRQRASTALRLISRPQHLCRAVLQGLEGAYRHIELDAFLEIGNGGIEQPIGGASISAQACASAVEHGVEQRCTLPA